MTTQPNAERPRPWQHLTDSDFGAILEEFRNRGYAIAVYGVAELGEGPLQDRDGDYDEDTVKEWLEENRAAVEDVMTGAVWSNFAHVGDEIHGGDSDG